MKKTQIILASIIYLTSYLLVVRASPISYLEIVDFSGREVVFLPIIVIPILISFILLIGNKKNRHFIFQSLLLFLLTCLMFSIQFHFYNVEEKKASGSVAIEEQTKILSLWGDGMPQKITYQTMDETYEKIKSIEIHYHENGILAQKTSFFDGRKTGNEIFINQDGSVKKIIVYAGGEPIKVIDYEDKDAKLSAYLSKEKKKIGHNEINELTSYLAEALSFYNQNRDGNYTISNFSIDGQLESKEYYVLEEKSFLSEIYYKNGQIKEVGITLKHDKIGRWKYFDEKGILLKEIFYDSTGVLINH